MIITLFSLFIFVNGNKISVANAFGSILLLKTIESPLRWVSELITSYLEFNVSMIRIQEFLLCSELNPNHTKANHHKNVNSKAKNLAESEESKIDILVENANFTWGGQKQKTNNKRKTIGKLQITNFLLIS